MSAHGAEREGFFKDHAERQIEAFVEEGKFGDVGVLALADLAEFEDASAEIDLLKLDPKYRPAAVGRTNVDVAVAAARYASIQETVRRDTLRVPGYRDAYFHAYKQLFGPLLSEAETRVVIPDSAKGDPHGEIADIKYRSAFGQRAIATMVRHVVAKRLSTNR